MLGNIRNLGIFVKLIFTPTNTHSIIKSLPLVVFCFLFCLLYQGSRLHWEAKRGHKGKVKSLVENGTNVDTKDGEGVSTLCD